MRAEGRPIRAAQTPFLAKERELSIPQGLQIHSSEAAAGVSNTTGRTNSFFGTAAGQSNTTGFDNSFYGVQAGFSTNTGVANSFFGRGAGTANTNGDSNSFFGYEAGMANTAGGNSYFGARAGSSNTTGLFNSFYGYFAGSANVDSDHNSFFGYAAGSSNTAAYNSFFGSLAGTSNTTGSSNSFFGDEAGESNTTGGRNTFIGRWSGNLNTAGADNTLVGFNVGLLNTSGNDNTLSDFSPVLQIRRVITIQPLAQMPMSQTEALFSRPQSDQTRLFQAAILSNSDVRTDSTPYCPGSYPSQQSWNCWKHGYLPERVEPAIHMLLIARYKIDIETFSSGLNIVRRLRPISFNWREGGMKDVRFGAERSKLLNRY